MCFGDRAQLRVQPALAGDEQVPFAGALAKRCASPSRQVPAWDGDDVIGSDDLRVVPGHALCSPARKGRSWSVHRLLGAAARAGRELRPSKPVWSSSARSSAHPCAIGAPVRETRRVRPHDLISWNLGCGRLRRRARIVRSPLAREPFLNSCGECRLSRDLVAACAQAPTGHRGIGRCLRQSLSRTRARPRPQLRSRVAQQEPGLQVSRTSLLAHRRRTHGRPRAARRFGRAAAAFHAVQHKFPGEARSASTRRAGKAISVRGEQMTVAWVESVHAGAGQHSLWGDQGRV